MNNDICTNENKCKDCDDRYTAVLEQVQALPIQWQMEIADTIYTSQGYKTREDIIIEWLGVQMQIEKHNRGFWKRTTKISRLLNNINKEER